MRNALLFFAATLAINAHGQRMELVWPTPNRAYQEGKPLESYIQPTASGETESGLFGCKRTGGTQFHEAIDLKPISRDRKREPTDPIYAVTSGVVRHINPHSGNSSYGRYIVLEHPDTEPAIYTLYAHLSAISPGLNVGDRVATGQEIGTLGRSASEQPLPKERAHLHFEMGLWLTRDFQSWYNWKKFGSRNHHGNWNGMNLFGFDPLQFYEEYRAGRIARVADFFQRMDAAVTVRISTQRIPDFVARYPALQTKPLPADLAGWELRVNEMGLPFSLTPLSPMEMMDLAPGEVRIVDANETLMKRYRCKSLALLRRGQWTPGRDLQEVLQLLFGVR